MKQEKAGEYINNERKVNTKRRKYIRNHMHTAEKDGKMTKADEKAWHKECSYGYFWESVPGIGIKTINQLYEQYGSYEKMYRADGEWGLTERKKDAFFLQKAKWNVKEEYNRLLYNKIWCIPMHLCGYPDKLKEIHRPPSALFVKGRLPEGERPAVAVVGARNCSPYGKLMAKELGKILAQNGIQVISGLAIGIDGISQRAAMEHGGASFGIMGCGVDICYPADNRLIYEQLSAGRNRGGIISEFMPGTKPLSGHFPLRNRIISGMADMLVVVEAKERSGTFITVSDAREQGRDVYAVPGRFNDPLSYGCNRLIDQGAFVLYDANRFIEDVFERYTYRKKRKPCTGTEKYLPITGTEKEPVFTVNEMLTNCEYKKECGKDVFGGLEAEILEILDIQYVSVGDILCALEGCSTSEILAALSTLECCGKVESKGSFYRKIT